MFIMLDNKLTQQSFLTLYCHIF